VGGIHRPGEWSVGNRKRGRGKGWRRTYFISELIDSVREVNCPFNVL